MGRNGGGTAARKLAEQGLKTPRYSAEILSKSFRVRVPLTAVYLVLLISLIAAFGYLALRSPGPDNGSLALKHYLSHLSSSASTTKPDGTRTSVRFESREEAGDMVIHFELLDEVSGTWHPLDPSYAAGIELNRLEARAALQVSGRCEARIPLTRFKLQGRRNELRIWIDDPTGKQLLVDHATNLSFRDRRSWLPW